MDDVMPFLNNVLKGRNVPEKRKREVAHHYELFGGVSPINAQNRRLVVAVRDELAKHKIDLPVYLGNRNWHPFLTDTIKQMTEDGIQHGLAFFTSAYSSYSGCRQYRENIKQAQDWVGPQAPKIDKIRVYYNHPAFIYANCDAIRRAISQIPDKRHSTTQLVFTAHSLPVSMASSCPYEKQLQDAGELIASELEWRDWQLVYQSRSGSPSQPWLEPDVCDHLKHLIRKGISDVVIAPIGFVSDHMEILFDLDTEARKLCAELGIHMELAKTVGTHPQFVSMIRKLVEERMTEDRQPKALGKYGPWTNTCSETCCLPQRIRT